MNPIKCPQCNLMNYATAVTCQRCGHPFQEVKRPMPPVRAAGTIGNLNAHAGAMANVKVPPPTPPLNTQPPTTQNRQINYQQQSPPTTLNSNSQTFNQTPAKPPQTQAPQQIRQQPTSPSTSTQVSSLMSSSAQKNAAMADIALEANSTSSVAKILMLPFTMARKIAGFMYSHKKVAALLLAPAAIAIVVGPNLLEAIKSANENSAIATIKQLNQAQTTFLATKFRCGELKELEQSQLIDSSIGKGIKSGYIFTLGVIPGGCEIYAKPTETEGLTATGNRSFYYSSRDNTLRVSEDKKVFASASSLAMDVGKDMNQEKPKIASAK